MKKIIIIDGNSLVFSRMPKQNELDNSVYQSKEDKSDIYIVRKFFKKILKYKYQIWPDYKIVVVFDEPNKHTFRHELYTKYKQKAISQSRKEQKDYIYKQIEKIKPMLEKLGIAYYSHNNWEADDIIGMLCKKLEKRNWWTTIVSGDKDIIQLVSEKIRIAFLDNNRNINIYGRNNIWEVSGEVWPDQIVGVKVLAGDKSDNIKGLGIIRDGLVDSWTQKEAKDLIVKYKTLENLMNNKHKIPEPYRTSLTKGEEKIKMRTELITIVKEWKINKSFEEFIDKDIIVGEVGRLINNLNLEDIANKNKRINKNLIKEGIKW